MWDELILPPFILRLVQRCFLISASAHTECSGSIHLTGEGGAERVRDRKGLAEEREEMRNKADILVFEL